MEKSIKPDALSWNSIAERVKYLSFGLYWMIPFMRYRLQTAFTVANQMGKFRAMWAYAYAAIVDYMERFGMQRCATKLTIYIIYYRVALILPYAIEAVGMSGKGNVAGFLYLQIYLYLYIIYV
jgi:hypothetical protein